MEDPVPPPSITPAEPSVSMVTPPAPVPKDPHSRSQPSKSSLNLPKLIRLALLYIGIYLGSAAVGASGYWVYWRMAG